VKQFIFYLIISLNLLACSNNAKLNKYYKSKKGDTLYSISKRYNIKLSSLIRANNIKAPYSLKNGQKLIIPSLVKSNKLAQPSVYSPKKNCNFNQPIPVKPKYNTTTITNKNWIWPANGPMKQSLNGIDITGKKGDAIMSTFNGKVVYSGNSLRGYGNLIIIKHDQNFLSAYAHNEKILVKEQQIVTKGQIIATMGDTKANKPLLYFEIRYKGQPIDPLTVLAKK
jgi:lipoprotein NlpD